MLLYDTLSKSKRLFKSIDSDNVRMYACGPTVYDRIHIGNGRALVVFDLLYRLLKHHYPKVTYVRNITDVDDKINARAYSENISIGDLTARTIADFHADTAGLNITPPNFEPRATDHIDAMIETISTLVSKGHAYVAASHVFFKVKSFADYGRLSGRTIIDDIVAGARVEINEHKLDKLDFVLWKPSTGDHEPGWDSPWGRGRPGWHIECSAMSKIYLGSDFDIHAGGLDLIFPHHENEIAQSCCAYGSTNMANYWLHNALLQVDSKKMAKSSGNFITVAELLKEWPGEVIRLALMSTHYRHPINWTRQKMLEARTMLDSWYKIAADLAADVNMAELTDVTPDDDFIAALDDDLNVPGALKVMHDLRNLVTSSNDRSKDRQAAAKLIASAKLLGLLQLTPQEWHEWWQIRNSDKVDIQAIEELVRLRDEARSKSDFNKADAIRGQLDAMGIVIQDSIAGTTWDFK